MALDLRESWGKVLNSVDDGVRSLVQISQSSEGRKFLDNLERGEAGLCIELLDRVRRNLSSFLTLKFLNHATGIEKTPI